ncbi:MAG TPA: ribosomal-protein-alanine N-acetyltransferase [Desulfurococcaceae archaeon]|nr:ribosomal-protein-alanine N-acetyltransferase [Desulfurococcaceae archaeon]
MNTSAPQQRRIKLSKEKTYNIREARLEDLDQVISINMEALPEHYPRVFWEEHVKRWGKAFLVAEVNGFIVGYIMCRVEWGWGFTKSKLLKKGHVISIAVRKEYRRKGIGRKLMEEAMKALKEVYGAEEVYLEVRVSNKPAINLYEKLGFKIAKRVAAYYLDGEDAYIMVKQL